MKVKKLSELDTWQLSYEQKKQLVLKGIPISTMDLPKDSKKTAALVLGATAFPILRRTLKATELYQMGYVQYIILCGGNGWKLHLDSDKLNERILKIKKYIPDAKMYSDDILAEMTECEFMRMITRYVDISDDVLILEYDSRNTLQNMQNINTLLSSEKGRKFLDFDRIIIITDDFHARRALLTAKKVISNDLKCSEILVFGVKTRSCNERIESETDRLIKYALDGSLYDAYIEISENGNIRVIDKI